MKQHPLNSGFTASSTARDVLDGIDLRGKNVLVTGGHSRLGSATTRALAEAGADVTVAARDPQSAKAKLDGIARVEVTQLDLLDPKSIDACAARWLATNKPLHILINCATAPIAPTIVRDARGYEAQFATGHLGHFQLTKALLPALRASKGARVVMVSSGAHRMGEIRWDDPSFETGYQPLVAYAHVKKANVLMAVELDRRYASDRIRAYAVHPGVVVDPTPPGSPSYAQYRAMGIIEENGEPIRDAKRGMKTPEQGVSTIVFAATSPLLATIGGVYLRDNDIAPIDDTPRPLTADDIPSEATTSSLDPDAARRLWELSERMT